MYPTVSVIIPNYNHASFLKKRIESVLEQTYQDFEIILMDDHSTDGSLQVINQYRSHPKVTNVIVNDVNSNSTFKQWNRGVSIAKGVYIWIAESDDYADKQFLEILVEKLNKFPTAGIAYCNSWIVDEHNTILHSGLKWYEKNSNSKERWENDFFNSGVDECKNYLIIHNTIFNASSVVFRKDIYEKAGLADESFRFAGDWMQWVKILLISDIVFVAKHLNYFRKHSHTTRQASYLEFKDLVEGYKVISFIKNHIPIDVNILKNKFLKGRWQLAYSSPLSRQTFRNLFILYQLGRDVDPILTRRILSYFKAKFIRTISR